MSNGRNPSAHYNQTITPTPGVSQHQQHLFGQRPGSLTFSPLYHSTHFVTLKPPLFMAYIQNDNVDHSPKVRLCTLVFVFTSIGSLLGSWLTSGTWRQWSFNHFFYFMPPCPSVGCKHLSNTATAYLVHTCV